MPLFLGVAVAGILGRRSITTPLSAFTKALGRLAEGGIATAIPGLGRRDEIGHMAAAAGVFRDSMVKEQAGSAADAAQEAAANVQTVAAATEELSASIGEIGGQVTKSAEIAG